MAIPIPRTEATSLRSLPLSVFKALVNANNYFSLLVRELCSLSRSSMDQVLYIPFCQDWRICCGCNRKRVVMIATIDNLLKGAATQALQVCIVASFVFVISYTHD